MESSIGSLELSNERIHEKKRKKKKLLVNYKGSGNLSKVTQRISEQKVKPFPVKRVVSAAFGRREKQRPGDPAAVAIPTRRTGLRGCRAW